MRVKLFTLYSCILLSATCPAAAESPSPTVIDFEQFTGLPSLFSSIKPPVTVGIATFSGGELLNAATFLPADPSVVYGTAATSETLHTVCTGCLPTITIDFAQPVSNFGVLIVNGNIITVTYIVQDDRGVAESIVLVPNFQLGAGIVTLPSAGIRQVRITSSAPEWDFFIDNVMFTREFEINVTAFIPHDHVIAPPQSRCGRGKQLFFEGDARGFDPTASSFRTRQLVTVIPDEGADSDGLKDGTTPHSLVGETRSYAPDALLDGVINAADMDAMLHDCTLLHDRGFASTSDMHVEVTRIEPKKVSAHMFGGAANPLVFGAPDIDWDFTITIDISGSSPQWTMDGKHDGFPAYEVYINNTSIYTYSPGAPPYTFLRDVRKLYPPLDVPVSRTGSLP